MTSTGNRLVRIALGSAYGYAAVTFAHRYAGPTMLQQMLNLELEAFGKAVLVWLVCLVNGYFAGLWISSGSDGQ